MKKKPRAPRRLRMDRKRRLQAAPAWMNTYTGKDIVRGYRRWFGVDKVCALVELKMCGVAISEETIANARRDVQQLSTARAEKKARRASEDTIDQDDQFAFIAGYTSGGAPYGVTWSEWDPFAEDGHGEQDDWIVNTNNESIRACSSEEAFSSFCQGCRLQ